MPRAPTKGRSLSTLRFHPAIKSVARLLIPIGILWWLVYWNWDQVRELAQQEKDWRLFAAAFLICGMAAVLTFVRWYLLVWAQQLPFRLRDAVRLGILGYVFNFVAPGLVGGDLFKAIFLAREQERRTVAIATVLLDRIIGLLALFWVGAIASLFYLRMIAQNPSLRLMSYLLWGCSVGGAVLLAAFSSPTIYRWQWVQRLTRLPWVGDRLAELYRAVGIYRQNVRVVVVAWAMSLLCHTGFIFSFHLVAMALGGEWYPTLGKHFLIFPLAIFVGAVVPLPGGMGATEGAFWWLYGFIGPASIELDVARGVGLGNGLGYRVVMLGIAAIGGFVYLLRRREIARLMRRAKPSEAEVRPEPRTG